MNDNRIVDLFMATRVLAGEPVRILPFLEDGYWRWGEKQAPITPEVANALLGNFDQRATLGTYQTNLPLNIEHGAEAGKIGTIAEMLIGDDGLYAKLNLTDKGKALLEDDSFDYLSPEIVWDLEDVKTGASLGPTVVGLAVTNYPFFGEATAMFSREAGERFEAGEAPEAPGGGEEGEVSTQTLFAVVRSALASVLGVNPGAEGEGPQNQTEVENMAENEEGAGEMQIPEAFTARLTEMESQIEQFSQTLAERDGQITAQQEVIDGQRGEIGELQSSRLRERFSRQVETLPHVGAENEQLVDQLVWLHAADGSEEREHFAYWTNLLSTVEQAMAQSAAFQDSGQPGHRQGGNAYSRFTALVQEEAGRRNLVVSEGDANYAQILMELAEANPDLYNEHIVQGRQ
jgi:uncharacterized coiled-coil protein SlyX